MRPERLAVNEALQSVLHTLCLVKTMSETPGIKILLAEDNDGHAWLLKDLLRRAGISNEPLRFKDGQEAWEYISVNAAGHAGDYVLLLDIRMSELGGIELLRLIKSSPLFKAMPVILVTCGDNPQEIALCSELGCAAYLAKPVELEKLKQALQDLGL